jgi:hypothetical protein
MDCFEEEAYIAMRESERLTARWQSQQTIIKIVRFCYIDDQWMCEISEPTVMRLGWKRRLRIDNHCVHPTVDYNKFSRQSWALHLFQLKKHTECSGEQHQTTLNPAA